MKPAYEFEISGIKCDNPQCDYADDDVAYEDYESWVNRPCPDCGANLLTDQDMATCRLLMAGYEKLKPHLPQVPDDTLMDEEHEIW